MTRFLAAQAVAITVKSLGQLLCQVESSQISRVPAHGPLILVCNHINFLDGPLVYALLQPRPVTGFAKSETWDNHLLGPMFSLCGAIPLHRGQVDRAALQHGLHALEQNKILIITPEGTRNRYGQLLPAHAGMVTLAHQSQAPILPLASFGGEAFRTNIRHLRRTQFHLRVGQSFRIRLSPCARLDRSMRSKITDEIMYQMAILLPPQYRGRYADLGKATTEFLDFDGNE
jgi:1-acyl-sn-glycerol-3-phosphate acyltransferase